ncbi:type II 3-dehydroquinate dehydratase [Acidaminobacter hydrogenoformans]|uniref:type II 3-dehydroquinate dehydratase n=1 Tax=Acidaminobacter hydrogenoformans TaxID=65403 RepID=UPI001FA6E1C1|nr:type II 3-dehydroquinate dehydratase [Acidaminobacter hydrogenoformans]
MLAKELGAEVVAFQTNCEGVMCHWIHDAFLEGIVFNARAWPHYSYGIRDAVVNIK